MSEEEESVDLELKSDQAKYEKKKKVRKRKSKTTCEDEDNTGEVKMQQKSKKMKIEPPQNNSLLKWLNKSVDKSQSSPVSDMLQINRQGIDKNKSSTDDFLQTSKPNSQIYDVGICDESIQICSQNSQNSNSKPIVSELLSKIDFSNLKNKLKAKLNSSPKSSTTPKTPTPIESKIVTSDENGLNKKKPSTSKKNKIKANSNLNYSQNASMGKETPSKITIAKINNAVMSQSIQDMFQTMQHGKSEKAEEVNGKQTHSKGDSDIESDEHSQFFDDNFHDSDDSGMIFLSNKYERRKVVDSADSDSVDSFVRTPVKGSELMAPPYSPLSPLCRTSPRVTTKSPCLNSLKNNQLQKNPRQVKSPLPSVNNSPWKRDSLLKPPRGSCKSQTDHSTNESSGDSSLQSPQLIGSNPCTLKVGESPKKVSKKLFESSKLSLCEPIKESMVDNNQEANENRDNQVESKTMSKKKMNKGKETTNIVEAISQTHATSSNNENVSDEDFQTPKKKVKSGRKKKKKVDDQQSQPIFFEKVQKKESKGEKKQSPNLNSSLLNYFKRVSKEANKSTEQIVDTHTTDAKPVDITTNQIKSDTVANSAEKKKHKKKSKKTKRSSCVEIRFDFESDVSLDTESKEKPKNMKQLKRQKSDNDCELSMRKEQCQTFDEASVGKKLGNNHKEQVDQEVINTQRPFNRKKSLIVQEEQEIVIKKKKKRKHKNRDCIELQNELKETTKDCKFVAKEDNKMKNVKNELETTAKIEDQNEIQQTTVEKCNKENECTGKEDAAKNEPAIKKKKSHKRPKKDNVEKVITDVNKEIEETEAVGDKKFKEKEVDHDDKENQKSRVSKRKSKEKKELQEHSDNVDEDITGEDKTAEEAVSLLKYFKKVDSLVDTDRMSSSNVLRVEAQVHTPPSTPSKWKRKSLRSISSTPTSTPDKTDTISGEGRRKSNRISEKRIKEETRRREDEILVLEQENRQSKCKPKSSGLDDVSDDDLFIVKEKKKSTLSPAPQTKVKLASIFVKKPKMSKSETEARQKFLQSGVPDAIRRQTELLRKQEEILEELEYYTFPVINHVTQSLATPRPPVPNSGHPLDLGRFKLRPESREKVTLAYSEVGNVRVSQDKTELSGKELVRSNDGGELAREDSDGLVTMLIRENRAWKTLLQPEQGKSCAEEWTQPTNVSKALSVLKKRVPSIADTSVYREVAHSLVDTETNHGRETEDTHLTQWSEKYKPESERDILGSRSSVDTLRCWLEAMKKAQTRPLYNSSDDESDFIDDNDSSSQFSAKHNTAVLIGPAGSGKTCTVYALAHQLGFKVIELNASCNRNGKRILSDLSEATQSHQVSHQPPAAGQITSFFGTKASGPALFGTKGAGPAPTTVIPQVIDLFDSSLEGENKQESSKGSKRKRKRDGDDEDQEDTKRSTKKNSKKERKSAGKLANGNEKNSLDKGANEDVKKSGKKDAEQAMEKTATRVGKIPASVGKIPASVGKTTQLESVEREKDDGGKSMSIILIEDADIIFSDYDEGFVAALSSLVATSKRPLILVTNGERAGHVSKLMRGAGTLVLHFQTPLYAEIGCFLQLVSILEGVKLSQDKSLVLVEHNRGDIRKCLLALQFYVLSRRAYPTQPHPPWCASSGSQLTSLWWMWSSRYKLPPLIFNRARTVLSRDHQPEGSTGSMENTQTGGPILMENRKSSDSGPTEVIEDFTDNGDKDRNASKRNGTPNKHMDNELMKDNGKSEKTNKDSQESGYGSASSQQNQLSSQQSQPSSQQKQQLSQQNTVGNIASLKVAFSRRFESLDQLRVEKCSMETLAAMLTCCSQADLMQRKLHLVCAEARNWNPCPQAWQCSPTASSSLDNDVTSSTLTGPCDVISRDLCASLVSCARGLLPASDDTPSASVNGPYEETRRYTRQAFSLQRTLLSYLSPADTLSRCGFPLDSYAALRTLARSEQARYATSSKRYNRFFNHLKSVNIHLSQSETEQLCRTLSLQ